jgi:hypothetical protein
MASRSPSNPKLLVVLLILAASLPSFMTIPFQGPQPLDFQNLWAFHHCAAAREAPYAASGAQCGDAEGREMRYPPLLYRTFAWTRWLSFQRAGQLFMVVVALGTVLATLAWIPRASWSAPGSGPKGLFVGLLLAQYPLLFAIERGNNDVYPLLAWTLAAWLFASGRAGAAGAVAGLAAILKLYPAFACVVVGVGFAAQALRRPERRAPFAAFAAGGVLAVLAGFAVVWRDSVVYFTETLPRISQLAPGITPFGHPLRTLWPLWGGWALAAPLLVAWCIAAVRVFERDPALVFAGGLAISTYFAGTSWDYNLITTFPLLVLLFRRAMRPAAGPLAYGLLLVGLVGIVGHREIFAHTQFAVRLHLALQWAFLLATALAAPRLAEARAAPGAGEGSGAAEDVPHAVAMGS